MSHSEHSTFTFVNAAGLSVALAFSSSLVSAPLARGEGLSLQARVNQYAVVKLTADLSELSDNQRQIIPLLIDAAEEMDKIFWMESYGDRDSLLATQPDPAAKQFIVINYGPWDRLGNNQPFIAGVGEKPKGAGFYPVDMTIAEFEKHLRDHPGDRTAFKSLYTVISRDKDGRLYAVPYHQAFAGPTRRAVAKLQQAASLAEDADFQAYLRARAQALLTDDYRPSDMLWMDMKNNRLDVVIGPIENYEDKLFEYKAAHECYVLLKDMAWSQRLAKYVTLLPQLQRQLPVDEKYKQEEPGSNSDLNAYDVIYYAGDCNAGSKTIAINLPNDEQVQQQKGSRRLQLKNAMRAKFDQIMVPIADTLIASDQRQHVTFDAFFGNTMFHEVAHGLGIKHTIDGQQTVRQALRSVASCIEEGKADILGLYMITQLLADGELTSGQLEDYYITFMAGIFRSVRFGTSSAHGKANMLRFNFFEDLGAFAREADGRYRVNMEKMKAAMIALSNKLLTLQGDGNYAATNDFVDSKGFIGAALQADLDRLNQAGIPVDVVFEQGVDVLGLSQ